METDGEELIDMEQENMEAPWGTIMGKHEWDDLQLGCDYLQ